MDIGFGVIGWQMTYHFRKVVRILSFGRPVKTDLPAKVTVICGWICLASAGISLAAHTIIFFLRMER